MISREEALQTLKSYWKNESLTFIAIFEENKELKQGQKPHGYFQVKSNDSNLLFPKLDNYRYKRDVKLYIPLLKGLKDGNSYQIKLDLDKDENRIKYNHPFKVKVVDIDIIEQTTNNVSAKEFIATWFGKKGENPGDAASIASQLKLNQLELYTQTKRFVFELIQNADDMPVKGKDVEINIQLLKDYFVFQHTGLYFNRANVKAISDAAQSTKKNDETKTGYKGIGFKSVFSDSDQVYIYSRDYSFKFDKTASIYKDFKKLYEPYWSKLTDEARKQFFIDYRGQEDKFTNTDNIPWQIKPIWIDLKDYPADLAPYIQTNKNVNIALGVGEAKINEKKYDEMIRELVKDPRFLLFLRHTKKIHYTDPRGIETSIEVVKTADETQVFANDIQESVYASYQDDILINNEAFNMAGFDLQHVEVEEGKWVFKNSEGKILENIPEKLGKLKETTLSFAVKKIDDRNIEPVKESESILYNYLPTSDYNYKFPFIVNADFVSKTDREGILAENIWNHYLFYHIGYSLIKWAEHLGKKKFTSSYLKILPRNLLDENNSDRRDINKAFNRGLKKGIKEIACIQTSDRSFVTCSEAIFDKTGFSSILSPREFLAFVKSNKKLVNWNINTTELSIAYLNIEVVDNKSLFTFFKDEASVAVLNERIKQFDRERYLKFLHWIESSKLDYDTLKFVKFIRFGSELFSLVEVVELSNQLFLKDDILEPILSLLTKNSSKIANDNYANYPHLGKIIRENTYISKGAQYYSKLVDVFKNKLNELSISDRVLVLNVLRNISGVDIKTVAKLPWYKDNLGEFKPLNELYNNENFSYSSNYNALFIASTEVKELPTEYIKELKSFTSLLDDANFNLLFSSTIQYDSDQVEVRFLKRFINDALTDANIYKKLAKKIKINSDVIDGELWKDEVEISYQNATGQSIIKTFNLLSLVNNLSTKNNLLELFLNLLPANEIDLKETIRGKIFELKVYPSSHIMSYIKGNFITLNDDQFLYLVIENWINKKNLFKLERATVSLSDTDKINILNLLYNAGIAHTNFRYHVNGQDIYLIDKNTFAVQDESVLFENEKLSSLLKSWANSEVTKLQYLVNCGCYGESNAHYKLRTFLKKGQYSDAEACVSTLNRDLKLFENTTQFIQRSIVSNTFNEQVYKFIISFYNNLSSQNLQQDCNFYYPIISYEKQELIFSDISNIAKFYKYKNHDEFIEKISDYIQRKGYAFIPENLILPTTYRNRVNDIKIESNVNLEAMISNGELYDADYYNDWYLKSQNPIYILSYEYIPLKVTFEDLILADEIESDETSYYNSSNNSYFICKNEAENIPFNLNNMSLDIFRSIIQQKHYYKKKIDEKSEDKKSKYGLSEEEEKAFAKLFGLDLSKSDRRIWNALATFKAIRHYEDKGYDLSAVQSDIENVMNKTYFTLSINGTPTRIYPRSARQNLLFVSIQLWNAMIEVPSIIYCLSKRGELIIIEDVKSLVEQDKNVIFKISADNAEHRKEIIGSYFSGKTINEYQYNNTVSASMILRLNKDPEYKSIFDELPI
ncbi:sacsin N-terminal ATP-binding-like domain-containing protein [Sphingobacterium sp. FBM7-1]|uniref:sacsin N-terminal ATP-binding-like domain-containing protein n=1 Tax=Sphingobacterium sp. FBM7-1 TaxID=2886688 RepID=UPI001D1264A0|nr:hypothetical protein [Sphingobacterium sp. FBM7-1]MCC2598427.1 hypothetical protein [Sphingobacterium sp. FBM7-1]